MKTVFCQIGGSMNNVCHISTVKILYPPTWKTDPRQEECGSIDEIKDYITRTGAELVMFGIRSNGIPNRAVDVASTEKLDKAFKRLEKILK
jgi:hypothetical protein